MLSIFVLRYHVVKQVFPSDVPTLTSNIALYNIPCTGRVPSANWFSQEYVSLKFGINEVKQLNSTKYYNRLVAYKGMSEWWAVCFGLDPCTCYPWKCMLSWYSQYSPIYHVLLSAMMSLVPNRPVEEFLLQLTWLLPLWLLLSWLCLFSVYKKYWVLFFRTTKYCQVQTWNRSSRHQLRLMMLDNWQEKRHMYIITYLVGNSVIVDPSVGIVSWKRRL
jgi:hypothetical protein